MLHAWCFFSFLSLLFFWASNKQDVKIFTEDDNCTVVLCWSSSWCRIFFFFSPSCLAGDIVAFVIKMHRPVSSPTYKNAFHGWLNLIVLSTRTKGINLFYKRNGWPVAVNSTRDCSECEHSWNALSDIDFCANYRENCLFFSLIRSWLSKKKIELNEKRKLVNDSVLLSNRTKM